MRCRIAKRPQGHSLAPGMFHLESCRHALAPRLNLDRLTEMFLHAEIRDCSQASRSSVKLGFFRETESVVGLKSWWA